MQTAWLKHACLNRVPAEKPEAFQRPSIASEWHSHWALWPKIVSPVYTSSIMISSGMIEVGMRTPAAGGVSAPPAPTWPGPLLLVILAAILLPTLAMPLGPDSAMFYVTGQKLLKGAIHYRDTIDVKPPLIYYLYSMGIIA